MARPCRERVDKFKNTLEKSTEVLASKVAETAGSLKSRAAPLAERAKESADFFAEFDFLEPTRRPAARKGLPQPVAAETECGPALPQLTDQTPGSATAAAAEAEAEAEADGAGQPGALAMPAGGTDAEAAAQGVDQGGGRACAAETDAPGSHAKAADALADETGETGLGRGGAPAVDGAGGERLAALGAGAPRGAPHAGFRLWATSLPEGLSLDACRHSMRVVWESPRSGRPSTHTRTHAHTRSLSAPPPPRV